MKRIGKNDNDNKQRPAMTSPAMIQLLTPKRLQALKQLQLKPGDLIKYLPQGKDSEDLTEEGYNNYKWMLAYEGRIGRLLYITPSNRCLAAFEDGFTYKLIIEPWDIIKVS